MVEEFKPLILKGGLTQLSIEDVYQGQEYPALLTIDHHDLIYSMHVIRHVVCIDSGATSFGQRY